MSQKEHVTRATKSPLPNVVAEEFAQAGQKQVETVIDMQKVILNTFERMNQDWLAGAQGLAKSAAPNLVPMQQFAESTQKPAAALIELQKELADGLENMNREWAARIKAEMDLAGEFTASLTAGRSIPDNAAVFQEWIGKRIKMAVEDGHRLAAHSQQFMAATARCFSNGWKGGSA